MSTLADSSDYEEELDCICGACPECRRAARLDRIQAAAVVKPATLHPLAAQILNENPEAPVKLQVGSAPAPKPKKKRVRNPPGTPRVRKPNKKLPDNPDPVHCSECGESIGLIRVGRGGISVKRAVKEGKCELCYDTPRLHEKIRVGALPDATYSQKEAARRAKLWLQRELRDGRPYSPILLEHGKYSSDQIYGCRCRVCVDARNAATVKYRKEKGNREKDAAAVTQQPEV